MVRHYGNHSGENIMNAFHRLHIWFCAAFLLTGYSVQAQLRDPFWPIGEVPIQKESTPEVVTESPEPVQENTPRQLTDEELREQAEKLSEQISQSFTRRATMVTNGKIYAHVGTENIVSKNPWVTQGDHFVIEILGNRYRMEVVKLTRSQIELEPYRVSATSP
jgi:hypothetical protein